MADSTSSSFRGKTWRINVPDVAAELIGNEVVAIHLPTGIYYSVENAGAVLWAGIEKGLSFEQLVQTMTVAYDVPSSQAESDVTSFLTDLIAEKLIVEAPGTTVTPASAGGERQPYLAPRLEKFPDLQDLLLIDPIHEVDNRGWPHAKPE